VVSHTDYVYYDTGLYSYQTPSGAKLSCRIHACPSKCHPSTRVPHTELPCQHILEEHCPKGHPQRRKCHQPSLPCKKCKEQANLAEQKRREEFDLQQKREVQQAEHERRLKELEGRINAEMQVVKDADLAQQRAQVIRQKQNELNAAQSLATSAVAAATSTFRSFIPSPSTFSTGQSPQASTPSQNPGDTSPSEGGNSNSKVAPVPPDQSSSQPLLHNSPRARPQTPPGNPATLKKSSPEVEWQRQKDVEGASCAAIDTVMGMIGLEEVKRQMLRIKDKIEVTKRQMTSINDERFNVVLLGNPGTGRIREH
jgi:hypothetical protein